MTNTKENQPRTNPQTDVWVETGIHGKSWELESLLNILIITRKQRNEASVGGINKKIQTKVKVDARPGLVWVLHPPQERQSDVLLRLYLEGHKESF